MKKKLIQSALAFLLVFGFLFGGCFLFDDTDDIDNNVVVKSVTISPTAAVSVAHGGTQSFTATVTGTGNPAQTVTWSVTGGARTATAITSAGVLSVASNETATTLTVMATSTVDTSKYGTKTVTVTSATATVTSVTVSPQNAFVSKGGTRQFSATVIGTNSPAQTVTWSIVEAGKQSGTTINSSGLLTISANESLTLLTVKATSTVDTGKSGNTKVTVGQIVTPTDPRILAPDTQTTKLSNSSFSLVTKPHGGGNQWLIQAQNLGYETWDEDTSGDANFRWFGTGQGGGAAFRAEWGNPNPPKDFLARVGYFWDNENPRKPHTAFGNIYCGFNFTTSGRYHGNFSYIGIYGWSRNPLVEYYIVENSYGNRWRDQTGYVQNFHETLENPAPAATEMASYTLDGATYKVYKKTRTGPSIAGNQTFTQYFSIRQNPRTSGTVSVTEHFKKWEERGMNLGTMYECKWKVEVGGNPEGATILTGWFDASFIQFYRANDDGTIIHITQ